MTIKFIQSLILVDGDGKEWHFEANEVYDMPIYWAKQFLKSGEAIEAPEVVILQ